MAQHNQLGKSGEQLATEFLISQGFIIRETNWRLGHLEIDIVAQKPGSGKINIVEVKSRTTDEHFDPMKAIGRNKIRNLVNAANGYVRYNQLRMSVQYDVILVVGREGSQRVQYIPNAFQPPLRTYR